MRTICPIDAQLSPHYLQEAAQLSGLSARTGSPDVRSEATAMRSPEASLANGGTNPALALSCTAHLDDPLDVKVGLARMLCGGVILDVTDAEQARIAEGAGATAVMALERVPADIRAEGGVARMAAIERVVSIREAVTIPVMAKARIGHFAEARVLQELGVDFIDESEVLTPADAE